MMRWPGQLVAARSGRLVNSDHHPRVSTMAIEALFDQFLGRRIDPMRVFEHERARAERAASFE